jgi:hypothetical protein
MEHMDNQAAGAMNLLYTYFLKMLDWKIIIEHKNWNHPGLPKDEFPSA